MSQKYCLVYSTCPKEDNCAYKISESLISEKLAACVNIVDNIVSVYKWDNKIETNHEKLLIIKTNFLLFEQIKEKISALHPYTCPEIIAVPIIDGNCDYLSWLDGCLQPAND